MPTSIQCREVVERDASGDPAHDDADDVDQDDRGQQEPGVPELARGHVAGRDGGADDLAEDLADDRGGGDRHDTVDGAAENGQSKPPRLLADAVTDDA